MNGWTPQTDPERIKYHHDINACARYIMQFRETKSFPSDRNINRHLVKKLLRGATPFKETYIAGLLITRIEL